MKKKIVLVSLLLVAVLAGTFAIVLNYPYSKGVRSGRLVKISKKGLLLSTYEGILDLGSGDELTWKFSTRDKDLGEQLVQASGKMVQLSYTELLHRLFYETKYNVTSFTAQVEKESNENFCRLVNLISQHEVLARKTKEFIELHDPSFINKLRECQN